MAFTIGSLFSGIGGLELGLEWAGLGPVRWQVEITPFCLRVLAKHWPDVPRYEDVRTFHAPEPVDIICGGFPCQDLSSCNVVQRKGLGGEKSGLWREFARIVRESRPRFVVVENVASAAEGWLPTVRQDLHMLGYGSRAFRLTAAELGANHLRPRVFVLAYSNSGGEPTGAIHEEAQGLSENARRPWNWKQEASSASLRMHDGLSAGLDSARIKALGNAVVPQCAQVLGNILLSVAS